MNVDRRQFVFTLGTAALAGRQLLRAADAPGPGPSASAAPWYQRLRRVGQLNFNERDPVELDLKAWADTWADLEVDAVLVSVTGILAFYPTDVPYHRRSRWLNNRDLFGECCAAAKARGIRVIARLSPDLQWDDALAAHPEWYRRDAGGKPVPHRAVPGLFQTCPFSTYHSEQIPAIMREVNARYDVDGMFTNAWPALGELPVCHCAACRNAPPPDTPEFHDRHLRRTLELWRLYESIAQEKRPDNLFYGNLGSGIHAQVNLKELATVCRWFNCDNQGREGETAPAWGCAQQGRVAYAVMRGRTTTNVLGTWATGAIRWRNTAKNRAEATLWMAQTAASGMRVWYHWLGGQTGLGADHRWPKAGHDFLRWQARHDAHFSYRKPVADLGVVWAQRPNLYYHPPGADARRRRDAAEFVEALYAVLLEGRFCFDFVHEDDLGADRLHDYRALLLPNVALLSDAQCRQLRAYAEGGGSLLATFETGLYDERGAPRPEFGLADVFGIARAGATQGPVGDYGSFARVEQPHEILRGLEDTNLLPGSEYFVPVRATGPAPVLSVGPAYSGYPPEMCYAPPGAATGQPAVVLREAGASRRAYFAGDCERAAWRSGNSDLARLLQNAIRWVSGDRPPVTVDGDGLLELFAWETDAGYAVHLLNYNNPNLHRGWFRKNYPVGPQRVTLEIPGGRTVAKVELLRAGQQIPHEQDGARVTFTIPDVKDYEVAAVTPA